MKTLSFFYIAVFIHFYSSLLYADDEPLFNQVNLQAQSQKEIPNDQLTVILAVEVEGKEPAIIAEKINNDMSWALSKVEQNNDINTRTLSYNTYPVYDNKTVIAWRSIQQLELKSKNITLLTKLIGQLQEKMQVKNMTFTPTRETREQYENELIEEALLAFKQRVQIIKKHMDGDSVRIVNINVNTGSRYPQPVYQERAMMAMDAKGGPSVESGTSTITVTVSGSVQYF